MNNPQFLNTLTSLTENDWNSLAEGQGILIEDDSRLLVGEVDAENTIIQAADFEFKDVADLQAQILTNSDEILSRYYLNHPLSKSGFNSQLLKLVDDFGIVTFCGKLGELAERTFFVEGGEVVSESADSPRHRYGVFFEMDREIEADQLRAEFLKWVSSGEAYSVYIGMNVCRYNC